jgi:hypothetical protein
MPSGSFLASPPLIQFFRAVDTSKQGKWTFDRKSGRAIRPTLLHFGNMGGGHMSRNSVMIMMIVVVKKGSVVDPESLCLYPYYGPSPTWAYALNSTGHPNYVTAYICSLLYSSYIHGFYSKTSMFANSLPR